MFSPPVDTIIPVGPKGPSPPREHPLDSSFSTGGVLTHLSSSYRLLITVAANAFVHPVKRVRAAAQATAVSERVALEEGVIAELGCTSGAA